VLKRIVVALIFLPVFVWLIYLPNPTPFFFLTLAALVLAVVELGDLLRRHGAHFSRGIAIPAVILMGLSAAYPELAARMLGNQPATALWTLAILVLLGLCLRSLLRQKIETGVTDLALSFFAVMLLGGVGTFVFSLRRLPDGPSWIVILFGFNWIYDSAALFAGKWFGRRKLSPLISPSKTVEGMLGGLAVNLATAVIVYAFWFPRELGFTLPGFAALGVGMGLLAQAGDLVESLIKRWSGAKDSSGFIPGHGGVLDKIDSSIFTAPVLFWIAQWLARP